MATAYTPNPYDATRPIDADWAKMGAAEFRALKAAFMAPWIPKVITATAYTAEAADVGQLIWMQNGGTITIPADLPPGLIGVTGVQTTNVVGGAGVTITCPPSLQPLLYEDNAFAVLMHRASNNWLISGNLAFTV